MNTYIYGNNLNINDTLRNFIKDKASVSFSRFNYLVSKVEVRITDENGPKGGEDKSCLVRITSHHLQDIVIKSRDKDSYASISQAFHRAKQTLARRLKHLQSINKQQANDPDHHIIC